VIPQLEKNLFHMECSGEGFNQDGCSDSIMRHADIRLSKQENVVPEAGLEIVLHLRKVEVGTEASLDEFIRVVIEEEPKVEQGTRNWCLVNSHAWLIEMPAAGPHDENGRVWGQFVLLAIRLKVDLAADGIAKVDLAFKHRLEGR